MAGLSGTVAVASGAFLIGGLGELPSWRSATVEAACLAASSWLTFWLARRDADLLSRTDEADDARRGELGRNVGWLVDVLILQGDAPTGADRGMLWIDDGRLCFSGDRTSFALSPDQVAGRCRTTTPIVGLRHEVRLPLCHPTLTLSIGLERTSIAEFRRQIHLWTTSASPSEGQLPPTSLGPGAASPGRLLLGAVFSTVYWVAVLSMVFVSSQIEGSYDLLPFILAFAVLGAFLRCWYPVTRWRAWRDRRRL